MASRNAATKVVEIQRQLVNGKQSPEERALMIEEQRQLWDNEFPGRPFEVIARTAGAQITA